MSNTKALELEWMAAMLARLIALDYKLEGAPWHDPEVALHAKIKAAAKAKRGERE